MQPSGMEAEKEIRKLINYLATHKHRLAYQDCKDNGLPIGSGDISRSSPRII
jgi:hypothetical protein